ncbi:MAG: Uma2 family endonuclease [Pyrinomonadaceae bacterium]|nr:Uma2 family endonuclease [Pyrinomonadaceae bacterium]
MSLQRSYARYSVEEYLAIERDSEERHEYLDGEIYDMAGESPEHGRICINMSRMISTQLLGKPCEAFSKDMKVRSGPIPKRGRTTKGLYSYPDLLVVCGELKFHDEHRDVLLNPKVIIEVISPSTEAFDRGEKWIRYQTWLPELTDYLLVSQSTPQIDHFHRQAGGEWRYSLMNQLEGSLQLQSIDCTLPLTDVYDRIVFPVEATENLDEESERSQHSR